MRYNGREVHYTKDDLIIYTPGIVVSVIDISDDYRSICLVADKDFAFESPTMRDALLRLTTLHHTALSLTDCSRGFRPHCRRLHQPVAPDGGLLPIAADLTPHRPGSRPPAFLRGSLIYPFLRKDEGHEPKGIQKRDPRLLVRHRAVADDVTT